MGESDVGLKEKDIEKLIKSDPDRYVIVSCPEGAEQGEVFKNNKGESVKIIKLNYLRKGLCIVDTDFVPEDKPVAEDQPEEDEDRIEKAEPRKVYELGYIDILSENFGEMVSRRLVSPSDNTVYSIIEFKYLPIVFVAGDLVQCFQKLVKFMLIDIFDLIRIFEDKELRSGIRGTISDLVAN